MSFSLQPVVLKQLRFNRPYFLWWITVLAVRVTGGEAQQRQQWSVQEEGASQHAMWGTTTQPHALRETNNIIFHCFISAVIFQGDSGGPLNCKGRDGKWYVQGVTSFVDGRGCNTPRRPTVFTRVATFIPWISEVREAAKGNPNAKDQSLHGKT